VNGKLLGMEPGTKGWRMLLDSGAVVIRRSVRFVEAVGHCSIASVIADDSDDEGVDAASHVAGEKETATSADAASSEHKDSYGYVDEEDTGGELVEQDTTPGKVANSKADPRDAPKQVQPARMRTPAKVFKDAYALAAGDQDSPATLESALQRPDAMLWQDAANEEMRSLREKGVYELVEKPQGVNLLKSKWVLKIKHDQNKNIERYKARLVAKGFTQCAGIDYDETFAPVVRHATLRALLATAAVKDLEVEQIDVKTAFPNGPLKEEIFMEPPVGFNFGTKLLLLLLFNLFNY
jgi:hypothetical protein